MQANLLILCLRHKHDSSTDGKEASEVNVELIPIHILISPYGTSHFIKIHILWYLMCVHKGVGHFQLERQKLKSEETKTSTFSTRRLNFQIFVLQKEYLAENHRAIVI